VGKNRYVNCLTPDRRAVEFEPPDVPAGHDLWPNSGFFSRALAEMEKTLEAEGLTFYLTFKVDDLPSYGSDVVALVIDDERSRVPLYRDRVRAVYTNIAARPQLGFHPVSRLSPSDVMSLAVYARNVARRAPALLAQVPRGPALAPLHELPAGTWNQRDLPIKPFSERPTTMFFGGSVIHTREWHARLKARFSPKGLSRNRMLERARALEERFPEISLDTDITPNFMSSIHAGPDAYSRRLMDAKISLVPRGTIPCTHRFFQSLRYGCIVITDVVPGLWFYDGAPVIQLSRWDQLEETVLELLARPHRMQTLHEESLRWWHAACSEEAVGRRLASTLNAQL
jgi:hypothetical protein